MRHLFRELPEACDNTLLIAERCDVSFVEGEGRYMPRFPCPEGENEESWFVKEVERGLEVRYPEGVPAYATERARYETDVILKKGYGGYFLVVADFINWAKDHGIRVGPGRGSGAGSMCAYAMRITDLDPVVHGLVFERFLNPERPSMPDFDVDFDERRRGEVIRYVTEKYGEERVAQIVTYGTIKAKQAVKDAARVMGHPFAMGEKLTKAMPPPIMGKDMPLSGVFDKDHPRYHEAAEFRGVHDEDPQAKEVVETALGLEGLKRQWGVHAAGVIMSSEPLIDLIPIMRREQDGQIITQFDYPSCETLGLVKMDFLGLRNLTILDDAIANVRANRGEDIDLEALSKDMTDPKAYEVLAKGDTLGVFQLDGGGTRTLLRQMQPTTFEDISATIALYRPGPMGDQQPHQLRAAQDRPPAGHAHPPRAGRAARGDPRRDAQPHRLPGARDPDRPEGRRLHARPGRPAAQGDGQEEEGGPRRRVRRLRGRYAGQRLQRRRDQDAVGRADALRGLRLQQGARQGLRADLLLDRLPQGQLPRRVHGRAADQRARRQGQVGALPQRVPPDGHQGPAARRQRVGRQLRRRRHRHPVRDGRDPQRRLPTSSTRSSAAARRRARIASFKDFLRKTPAVVCNKRTIESLVKAGAFDSLGHSRRGIVEKHDQFVDALADVKRQDDFGQDSLFDALMSGASDADEGAAFDGLPELPTHEWDKQTLLTFEREMLGLYVSDHPLFGIEHVLTQHADTSIAALMGDEPKPDGTQVIIAGLITGLQIKRTKKGDLWAIATVEDLEGAIECLFFPSSYATVAPLLRTDVVCVVRGRVSSRDDSVSVYAQELTLPDIKEGPRGPVVVNLPLARATDALAEEIKRVLGEHPGATEVHLKLTQPGRSVLMKVDDRLRVTASPALFGDLKALLGPSCLS